MNRFEQLISMIRSGQLLPAQIAAEMQDRAFAAYYAQQCN